MSKGAATEAHAHAAEEAEAAVTAPKAAKEPKAPKEPRRGVGTVACEAIMAGKTNQEALEAVKAEFPEANTSMASINWYRNNLRTSGEDVPTARALGAEARASAKAERSAAKAAEKAQAKEQRDREKAAKKKTAHTAEEAIAQDGGEGGGDGDGSVLD